MNPHDASKIDHRTGRATGTRARARIAALLVAGLLGLGAAGDARAAIYVVSNVNDGGPGSLRKAINDANAASNADAIVFQIAGASKTIKPATALPAIWHPVVVDGTQQAGYAGLPIVEIDGSLLASGSGLVVYASSSTIKGVVVNRFPGYGIVLDGSQNAVKNCFIGTGVGGTIDRGNNGGGISVSGDSNLIGGNAASGDGNLISGNGYNGIMVWGDAQLTAIHGNRIGTDRIGASALGNDGYGIRVYGPSTQIGSPSGGNLISGNGRGIGLEDGATTTFVRGNIIGLNVFGTVKIPNDGSGIEIASDANLIGGAAAGAGNVISGNAQNGILLEAAAGGNTIAGNRIGTTADGSLARGNSAYGIRVIGATTSTIGGTAAGAGNLISGNGRGISFEDGATGNVVHGNVIGLSASGNAKLPNDGSAIEISAPGNVVGGAGAGMRNVLSGNAHNGVAIDESGDDSVVQGNYIGTNPAGTSALGNGSYGIRVIGATSCSIGGILPGEGNLISGNGRGVSFEYGATSNRLYGNVIGLSAAGTAKLPNDGSAVELSAPGNIVGGTVPGMRNVLSGNTHNGVVIDEGGDQSVVQGNYIGTNAAGTAALGNGSYGIRILEATGCLIGGTAAGAGNVVSGNERGISLEYGASGNTLQGNVVGLDKTGTAKVSNLGSGLEIYAPGNTIGGIAAGAGNVFSGNHDDGIVVAGAEATGNVIQGNKIGTAANGTTPLGNRYFGIHVYEAFGNTIGGTAPGAGNVVAGNEWRGLFFSTGHGNAILGNSIFQNAELGIDLDPAGLVPNDAFDSDLGANRQQNFPVLTSVVVNGAQTQVSGMLRSRPNASHRIEVFASPACDESGFGEGRVFIGSANVTTNGAGEATFQTSLPIAAPHPYVTATATSAGNDTSELSPCALVGGPSPGVLQFAENPFLGWEQDGSVTIAVTRSMGVAGAVSVNYTTKPAGASAPADYAETSGTLTFAAGEVVKTFTVPVVLDDEDEGNQESIGLELSSPTGGATLGAWANSELILIDHDDEWPNVTMSDASVIEGNGGSTFAAFTVSVSPSSHPVTVQYGSRDGTAKAGQDYQETTGSITFQPGDAPQQVLVPILGDATDEDDEVFFMRIYDVGQATVSGYPTGVIFDDDGPAGSSDLLFKDGFEGGSTGAWSSVKDDGSGLVVSGASAIQGGLGLGVHVDDKSKLWVQDDSPAGEVRYRARFYIDATSFHTGGANGQKTMRIFSAHGAPAANLLWMELRSKGGQHQVKLFAKVKGGKKASPWITLIPGAHWLELDWSRSSTASANDGFAKLWLDGNEVASLAGLDIETGAIDFVRLGAVVVKSGAQGTLVLDAFESRRLGYIGPGL